MLVYDQSSISFNYEIHEKTRKIAILLFNKYKIKSHYTKSNLLVPLLPTIPFGRSFVDV